MSSRKRASYFPLIAAGEPFRLLFPLGLAIGIIGVLLWPAHVLQWWPAYPGIAHPRIMIEGFLTCFVIGFLGTALPRLLEVPRMTWQETWAFAGALGLLSWFHLQGRTLWGDLLFFAALLSLVIALSVRAVLWRKDTPPPAFVLVAGGLLCGLIGSGLQSIARLSPDALSGTAVVFGQLLLYQGYLLLPIMGVGAFLLPRFFGLPSRQSFPESLTLPPGWRRRAAFAAFCGGVVIASLALETGGWARTGFGLRTGAVLLYFFIEVPVHRAGTGQGTLFMALRLALFSIPLGYLLMALWPDRSAALIHVVMITGFSLLTLTVATRVILGHSGQAHRFKLRLPSILILTATFALAMITRVSADWMPASRMPHLAYAGVAWVVGALVWAVAILPSVRVPDEE